MKSLEPWLNRTVLRTVTGFCGSYGSVLKQIYSLKRHSAGIYRARLVHVFKNWKLLFENICGNTCGWKSMLKYIKWCLKIKNYCLKTQTKHPHTDQKTDIKRERIWKAKNRKKKKKMKREEKSRERKERKKE